MSITQDKIDRINALARKAKSDEGLTDEEIRERQKLRQEYIESFRGNLESQLKNIRIIDENGKISEVKKRKKKNLLN
ncbi:MAG: DUF896 domain-containing protein [Anaerovoracaceae bacterium]